MARKIAYQENIGGLVTLLPDGRVRFLHPSAKAFIEQINNGLVSLKDIDFDDFIIDSPLVDLNQFHLNAPAIAFIETTNLCNLRCEHCYAWSGEQRQNEMTSQQIYRLLDELSSLGVLQVFLTGGELFAHPDALDIIQHARTKAFSTQIFTNGLLITEEKLKKIPKGQSFFVSFDTAVPERSIRGKMNFPKLKKCFSLMRHYGHVFRTAISVHSQNINDVEEIFEWCIENHYPRPQWLETHPIGRALINPHIMLKPEQVDEVFEVYVNCMDKYQRKTNLASNENKWHSSRKKEKLEIKGIDTIKFCQQLERATGQEKCGRTVVYINSSGSVYPCSNCMSNNQYLAGNIKNKTFKEIWDAGFSDFRDITFSDFSECDNCAVQQSGVWCQFRCPPLSKNLTNQETQCGATEYLRLFMLKSQQYWNSRREQGYKLELLNE